MKAITHRPSTDLRRLLPRRVLATVRRFLAGAASCALAFATLAVPSARGSTAYGSINNFDVVNDTGTECHGFEVELEDTLSTDISYTYDWNHYGKSRLASGLTAAGKPCTLVRWESARNPDGTWAAYTAIPTGPIAPTDGHMFTDPSVNFGGEHFGCGFMNVPTAVRYFWLVDNGSGTLVRGPEVQVSTPIFNYAPPVQAAPAQVQAVIVPPAPAAPSPLEFGPAMWVKEIRTTTHNAKPVALRDLVSDDPADAHDKNWRNGEPDEVEVEWQLLQTDFNKGNGGANGELAGAPEALNQGDEVVTRRWEFFKYTGPIDLETGEAMSDSVAADGVHGKGTKTINGEVVDLSTLEVVGDYIGAQMSAFDADAKLGLIDVVPDADLGVDYAARTIVIPGLAPFSASIDGALPLGMDFDPVAGVLSGTPSEAGVFSFTISADDGTATLSKLYTLQVAAGAAPPPQSTIQTSATPAFAGTTSGDGIYDQGTDITVTAAENAGYAFAYWTENDAIVSLEPVYTFTTTVNRALVAHFVSVTTYSVTTSASPATLGTTSGDGTYADAASVTVVATANPGAVFMAWSENGTVVSTSDSYTFTLGADRVLVAEFAPTWTIALAAAPTAAGTVAGGGVFSDNSSVNAVATANAGYAFANWTEGNTEVSTSASYTFMAHADRALVAHFVPVYGIALGASPAIGGSVTGAGSYVSGATVSAVASANPGYAFVNWTEGSTVVSTSVSYSFSATAARSLTATFAPVQLGIVPGNFHGLVANLTAPATDTCGLISLSVTGTKGAFTGTLTRAGGSTVFKGTFKPDGTASIKILRAGKAAIVIALRYTAADTISGTVDDGISTAFIAALRPYSASAALPQWPGSYTQMVGFPRRGRAPLPVATGTEVVTAAGQVRLAGKLSDGSSYACSSYVTTSGGYALYAPTKLKTVPGFLVGSVALDAANLGSTAIGSPVTWKPATAQAYGRFTLFTERYMPPGAGKTAIPVDLGTPNLDILETNAIGGMVAGWKMQLKTSNVATDLATGPVKIALSIAGATGVVTGKLSTGSTAQPFTGVVWQSSRSGFAILPGLNDQATLTLVGTYTGP